MKRVRYMGKDSETQRIRKNASIMLLEFFMVFNITAPLLSKREQDWRKRLAVKDKWSFEGGKWSGMMKFQVPLESGCQNVIRGPEILLISLCNRTSMRSIMTMRFPLCSLYHRPTHGNIIPELAIEIDVIPGGKFESIRSMIEQCPIDRMKSIQWNVVAKTPRNRDV